MKQTEYRARRWVLLALFVSGLAGLMHEVVWARFLVPLIGNTAHSNAVVLMVFMGGLAVGAALFGKRSDRWHRPLAVYALLEVAIAGYCLMLPFLGELAGGVYEALASQYFDQRGMKFGLRVALACFIALPPAVMMGGTLPILARYLVADITQTRKQVASLYALNNLGAVVGSGLAGFFALPFLGIRVALFLASAGNLIAAALVWRVHRSRAEPAAVGPSGPARGLEPARPGYGAAQYRITLIALFLTGFAAMGYEVVFLRVIALAIGSSTYSFTVMLMCFITGISLGSGILSLTRPRRPLWLLGASQVAVVVAFVAVLPLLERLPYWISLIRIGLQDVALGFESYQLAKAGLCLLFLLIPTLCIGISFPLVAQIQARSAGAIGRTVGSTYAWSTTGNVLGVAITALVLLPAVGVRGSLEVNLVLSAIAGLAVLSVAPESRGARRVGAVAILVAASAVYGLTARDWPAPINRAAGHLRQREDAWETFESWKSAFVIEPEACERFFLEEDENNTVMAFQDQDVIRLFVNGKGDASTIPGDMLNQLLLGHLPLLAAGDANSALVIGYGSGVTLGAAALHPDLERLDVVEISRAVLAADPLFAEANGAVLQDERVHVFVDDARSFLRTVPRKYDVIVSEPSNPWVAGISGLFTRGFFQEARSRLEPGGVLCVWIHQYEMNDENLRLVFRTLGETFEDVAVFQSNYGDVICLASAEDLEPDFAAMERRFEAVAVRHSLYRIGMFNLASILAHHAVAPSQFHRLAGEGPVNTDDHQRLEFDAPRPHFLGTTTLLIDDFRGFAQVSGGSSDSWLDRYIDYRSELGVPVCKSELRTAAATLQFTLASLEHRLAIRAAQRTERAGVADKLPEGAARGGNPDLTTLGFFEAYERADWFHEIGVLDGAVPLYRRALEHQPDHPECAAGLARILSERDEGREAIEILDRAILSHSDRFDLIELRRVIAAD